MKTIMSSKGKEGRPCDRCAVCGVVVERTLPQCPRCGGDVDLARNLLAQDIAQCLLLGEDDIYEVAERVWSCGYKAEAYLIREFANLVKVHAAAHDAATVAGAALAVGQQHIRMLGGVGGLMASKDRVKMHGAGRLDG